MKQAPIVDDADRVLVGAGRVLRTWGRSSSTGTRRLGEYRSYVWDRAVQHPSARRRRRFFLPYHELLERAVDDRSIDLRSTLDPPPDRRKEFSYAGEHVTHDGAIAAYSRASEALKNAERASKLGRADARLDR